MTEVIPDYVSKAKLKEMNRQIAAEKSAKAKAKARIKKCRSATVRKAIRRAMKAKAEEN